MKGELIIDNLDAYTTYGLSIAEGGHSGLVCFPQLKSVAYNDWHEKNGIDPDLSAPALEALSVPVDFNFSGSLAQYSSLISALSSKPYHVFTFNRLGLTKTLRLVNWEDVASVGGLSTFTLLFSDDKPLDGYVYEAPSSSLAPYGDFFIDGKDVSQYGVRILGGTLDSLLQLPEVKQNLEVSSSTKNGVTYDDSIVTYKSRTARLKCHAKAKSTEEFWRNMNALLYDLIRPNERTLTVSALGVQMPFYYKSCKVDHFYPDSNAFWYDFTLDIELFKGGIVDVNI